MDRVHEELGRDARFALVLAEPEQPEARDHDDRWVRVAKRGRGRFGVRLVVGGVCARYVDEPLADARLELCHALARGIPRDEHRRDARAEEVIGTARAHPAQVLGPLRAGERQRVLAAVVVRDHAPVRRDGAAKKREDRRDDLLAVARRRAAAAPPKSAWPSRFW